MKNGVHGADSTDGADSDAAQQTSPADETATQQPIQPPEQPTRPPEQPTHAPRSDDTPARTDDMRAGTVDTPTATGRHTRSQGPTRPREGSTRAREGSTRAVEPAAELPVADIAGGIAPIAAVTAGTPAAANPTTARRTVAAETPPAEIATTEAGLTEAGLTEAGLTEAGLTEAGLTEAVTAVRPAGEIVAEQPNPTPLMVADGLGLRTRRGWVFQGVDLVIPAGTVIALAGPSGSGRSMLLLTLAGRARPTTGQLAVAGDQRRTRIRRAVAVARVTAAAELEPELPVIDHVREARLLNGKQFDYAWARDLVGFNADPTTLVADLPTDDAVLFSVALALAGRPQAIVVDDVDIAATAEQQTRIWRALNNTGVTVIASTVDGTRAQEVGATVVTMAGGGRR